MRVLFTLLFLIILSAVSAQTVTPASQEPAMPEVATVEDTTLLKNAEVMPEFPGGQGAMMKFLQNNIRYPQLEKEKGVMGTVYISYIVEKDGSITNITPLKEVEGGPGLTKEAMRIVKMFPKQNPGMNNGKPVRVQIVMPVKFVLQ